MARLTAEEQAVRNEAIVRDRARGLRWSTIASRHGVNARRAQQIVDQHRKRSSVDSVSGTEAIIELIEQIDHHIEECAELIETTTNPSVKLGAMNAKLKAQERRIEIAQALGLLPHKLALAQHHDFVLRWNDAFREAVHRLSKEDQLHVLEPLDELLFKMESDPEAWRIHQSQPRVKREMESKQAKREIEEEKRAIERAQPAEEDGAEPRDETQQ